MLIDTHVHISHPGYDGTFSCAAPGPDAFVRLQGMTRETLRKELDAAGVRVCIDAGIDPAYNERMIAMCRRYPGTVFAAAGIHPKCAPQTAWAERGTIRALLAEPCVAAVGELGLDYYYGKTMRERLCQIAWFAWQVRLADKAGLPLVLHIRDADRTAVFLLKLWKRRIRGGVCHCFHGGAAIARVYTESLGLMLGIGGALLQRTERTAALEEAVRAVPLTSILLETDGPYQKPARPDTVSVRAWRQVRNSGLILPAVAARIAELKGIDPAEVERVTTENAVRLFHLNGRIDTGSE